jgi:quinol monooxygenase YgiN
VARENVALIVHVTFEINGDQDAFEAWYLPLVDKMRAAPGCISYDYLVDPSRPGVGRMIEAWERPEDRTACQTSPQHVEMVARGSRDFGMANLSAHRWRGEDHVHGERPRTETPIAGRDELNRLVAEYIAQH